MTVMLDLEYFRGLAQIMTGELLRSTERTHPLWDDCAQEAMIRAWQVHSKNPDKPLSYVHAAARRAVIDVIDGRPFTGQAGRRGYRDAADSSTILPDDFDPESSDRVADEAMHDLMAEDVKTAISTLPDRDKSMVRAVFWERVGWSRAGMAQGLKPSSGFFCWRDRIKPRLAEALKHWAPESDHSLTLGAA